MINGEGAEEKVSSAVTSPCDPTFDRESDGGDALSHYSSCGESEFEKYCSASSVMGTPSFLSSSFQDSDFGSLKSFKLGGENIDFKNAYSSCGESEFEKYCSASSVMGTPSFLSSSFQDSDFGSLKSFKLGGENIDFKNAYSSCGESEFEKYCSASSVMGTPSFLSSPFQDSDFGSLKSFKLGGENIDFKNFGDKKISSGFHEFEGGAGSTREEYSSDWKEDEKLDLNSRMEGFVVGGIDAMRHFNLDDKWGNGSVNENISGENSEETSRISAEFLKIEEVKRCYGGVEEWVDEGEGLEILGDEGRILSDEGEASSRHEHSDGEDSMFGCGSDDDRKIDSYYGKNVLFHGEESGRNENKLLMNSKVAFGSDDWDDFIQENGENTIVSLVQDVFKGGKQQDFQSGIGSSSLFATDTVKFPGGILSEPHNEVRITSAARDQVQAASKLAETNVNSLSTDSTNHVKLEAQVEGVKSLIISRNQVSEIGELTEYLESNSGLNIFERNKVPPTKEVLANEEYEVCQAESKLKHQFTNPSIASDFSLDGELGKTKIELDPLTESVVNNHQLVPMQYTEDRVAKLFEDNNSFATSSLADTKMSGTNMKNSAFSFNQIEDHFGPVKTRDFELNGLYDEIVNDMEDILLDSGESPRSRHTQGTRMYQSQSSRPSRDGGSSASTSGTDNAYNWIHQPLKIDTVEVVGARQIEGDVSLSERLVGVKKYTVYKIRVRSGEDCWEVERRYRDFSTLYHRLKKVFAVQDWTLPSPWSFVDRESRKLFGNASPDVIADRSVLIQECLHSIIHPKFPSSSLSALISFLSPSEYTPDSPAYNKNVPQSLFPNIGTQIDNFSTLGKTISLNVQIRPFKSMKQMLDSQHYRCAGCHRNFDDGRTRMQEYFQALGWGKPRLCEYSSQLFCASCHNNDTAVLPARVLHYWDFTRYPVSQMAKSYLDSIYDQPMLCVSAVNPFLFSKVQALQHVANIRNRIGALLPYVRCPFRRSIDKGLGSRRYLLDSNDFFALRDLIDLSKGMFSVLPVMAETVSRKIEEHITEQCLICYDVGIPCNARQACSNPLSLIFPFQEGEVEKCRSCELVFHKNCFKTIASCPCGARLKQEEANQSGDVGIRGANHNLNLLGATTESGSGILAGLFSKVKPRMSQSLRRKEPKDDDNVILMSSLTNSSL